MAAARSSRRPRRRTPPSRSRRRLVTSPTSPRRRRRVEAATPRRPVRARARIHRLDRRVDAGRADEPQRRGDDRGNRGPGSPDRESRPEHRAGDDASDRRGPGECGGASDADCLRAGRGGRAGRAGITTAGRSAISGGRTHRCRRAAPTGRTGRRGSVGPAAGRRGAPVVAGFLRSGLRDFARPVPRGSLPRGDERLFAFRRSNGGGPTLVGPLDGVRRRHRGRGRISPRAAAVRSRPRAPDSGRDGSRSLRATTVRGPNG